MKAFYFYSLVISFIAPEWAHSAKLCSIALRYMEIYEAPSMNAGSKAREQRIDENAKLFGVEILKSPEEHLKHLSSLGYPAQSTQGLFQHLTQCCVHQSDLAKIMGMSVQGINLYTTGKRQIPPYLYPRLVALGDSLIDYSPQKLTQLGVSKERAEEIISNRRILDKISLGIPGFERLHSFNTENLIDLVFPINSYKTPHPDERALFDGQNPRTFVKWRRNSRPLGTSSQASWGRESYLKKILNYWDALSNEERNSRTLLYAGDIKSILGIFNSELSLNENFQKASEKLRGQMERERGVQLNIKNAIEVIDKAKLRSLFLSLIKKEKSTLYDWESGSRVPFPKDGYLLWKLALAIQNGDAETLQRDFSIPLVEAQNSLQRYNSP
ncbi:MAG: hypothetical protein R3A80_02465 [Bdellovibrionota bacterium]